MTARGTRGVLARILDQARGGAPMHTMTVLSKARDPFRLDTARFRDAGQWVAEQIERIGRDKIHIRGIHYATLGEPKPNGMKYANTDNAPDDDRGPLISSEWPWRDQTLA